MRHARSVTLALAMVVSATVAFAQPAAPPPAPTGTPSPASPGSAAAVPAGSAATAPAVDDAKIKELVDREVARILNERAAKEAAERAAKEATDQQAATPAAGGDITGSSGFFDTRLAFTLTNENVLVKPGETIPSVPGWRFGVPNSLGVLFFDNYDTRYSGFETLSHAVMYRDFHKGHFDAEGGLVLRLNELSGSGVGISDDGSYIVLSNWKDPTHKDPTRVSLTVFPVSADRFRLGYSYRLSWGGNPEYHRTKEIKPGLKFQYDTGNAYAFVGAKSAVVLDRRTAEPKSVWGVLAGAGIDPIPMLRLEVNGGYFDRGDNELYDVQDQKVQLFGASVQASLHQGMPVGTSVDYKLYKNNGERVSHLFDPVVYHPGVSWLVMSELTMIGQTLKDPEKTGSTTIQKGMAGDVNVRVQIDRTRLRFDASFRDLAFILHSQPSLPTYSDFPKEYDVTSDFFAAVGADQNWNDFLTLGLTAGVEKPATLVVPTGIPGDITAVGKKTVVVRNNNIDTSYTILPDNQDAVLQFALKGSAKLTFGRVYSVLLEVFYSYDGNTTRYSRPGPEAPLDYVFDHFNQLGVNATLQARF